MPAVRFLRGRYHRFAMEPLCLSVYLSSAWNINVTCSEKLRLLRGRYH